MDWLHSNLREDRYILGLVAMTDKLSEIRTRAELPELERAVSDTLDEHASRIHGIVASSWSHPVEFLVWLEKHGYIVRSADEVAALEQRAAASEAALEINDGFLTGVEDKLEKCEQQVEGLERALPLIKDARRLLAKVVPADQDDMIRWAVKSGDAVYTNAGAAYRNLVEALAEEKA